MLIAMEQTSWRCGYCYYVILLAVLPMTFVRQMDNIWKYMSHCCSCDSVVFVIERHRPLSVLFVCVEYLLGGAEMH